MSSKNYLKRFSYELIGRLLVLFASLILLAWLLPQENMQITGFLVILFVLAQFYSLILRVQATNRKLSLFVDSISNSDFAQGFRTEVSGAYFPELSDAMNNAMDRFRQARLEKESQSRYLHALLEHMPVAMVTVHADGEIELLNGAARRLFNRTNIKDISSLEGFGTQFQCDVTRTSVGESRLTRLQKDQMEQHLIMSTTQITMKGRAQKLISLQNVHMEIEATEFAAWQDLVSVLSHEITNSVTPIASLARTASEMLEDEASLVESGKPIDPLNYTDIKDAAETVARRSEGLMDFVQHYKKLSRIPQAKLTIIDIKHFFSSVKKLVSAEWQEEGPQLELHPLQASLTIQADETLLGQAVLNLLHNARDAVAGLEEGKVSLGARLSGQGNVIIEVADNGPGVLQAQQEKMFLPFYTTKANGSGIGLALVRQIMRVHRGSVSYSARPSGGSVFSLSF